MNSELAYQMRRLSINSSSSIPPPPEMLPALYSDASAGDLQGLELDCSGFDSLAPSPSFTSSYGSLSSASDSYATSQIVGNGLSRSRCMHDLSALGGSAFSDGTPRVPSHASSPTAPWGYYVDTRSR